MLRRPLCLAPLALLAVTAGAQSLLLTDRFSDYEHGRYFGLTWHVLSGEWRVEAGRLLGSSPARGVAWASAGPVSEDQRDSVRVTPLRRIGSDGWAAAALVLWLGETDFWRLALVEGPDGRRYAELLEMRNGTWQAQSQGTTRLELSPGGLDGFAWDFGHTYQLRLAVSPTSVLGEVTDDATGDVLFRRGHPLPPGADAVRKGRPALMVDAMDAAFDDLSAVGTPGVAAPRGHDVAILDTGMPDSSHEVIALIRAALAAEGFESSVMSPSGAPGEFAVAQNVGLLVLPHTRRLPLGVAQGVDLYLRRGGAALFLGGPFASEALAKVGGEWLPRAEALASTPTDKVVVAFTAEETAAWHRDHGPQEGDAVCDVDRRGPRGGGSALRVRVSDLHSWDTLGRDFPASPFAEGLTLTCFWAKGGPSTTHLTLEWQETDGSRWMTAVPLTHHWRRYGLAPQDFAYWSDSPSVGRGGPQDAFHPERARRFAIGLAKSHSPLPEGPHAYWIADIGVARSPLALTTETPPIIEAVSPAYKTFRPGAVREIVALDEQAVVDLDLTLPAPPDTRCALPRSRGLGLKGARLGRWVPLLEARDAQGAERGCVASLYLSMSDPYPDAAWGVLGTEDAGYLVRHQAQIGPVIGRMARWLADGVCLAKAGSDQFGYLPGERPLLGGQVSNRAAVPHDLRLRVGVRPSDRAAVVFDRAWPLSAAPGTLAGVSGAWTRAVEPGVYRVRVELLQGDTLLDVIAHEFLRLPEAGASPADFVQVRDGDFALGGKPWRPHGINYWPSNATALEPFSYWLHWLHPSNYDPAVISRDLQALADLKLNSVSIALGDREQLPACLHFLYQCRQHGIRANVFLGGGDPAGFNVERARELIQAGRLADDATIWAWDIAWEPHFGAYETRRALDPQWAAWIVERYGSVTRAEADWGCPAPRAPDGSVTGPSQDQILTDGDHRVMVAAFRRFLDDLVSSSYGRWARAVHEVDSRHLIGVRSGYGGTGQPGVDPQMPFDLVSGAKHLDFISPEGYGLGGPWESFEQGGFTTAYARHAGGGKPVFWAEFGMSVHPEYTPARLEAQRLLYEHLYRMVVWSGANGSAGWWFPGGFRVGENSDFGIMNPDGSPRPAGLEARAWAERIAAAHPTAPPQAWLTIDRDRHVRGYSQVWLDARDEYVRLRRLGERVGLRTEGTGTDSTNTPLVAVGNTPCDGTNPPRYLNAEFNLVRLRVGGDWTDIAAGSTVPVRPGHPIELFVSVGNTGEALWVAPAHAGPRPGGVHLVGTAGTALPVDQPLSGEVARFADAAFGPFVLAEGVTGETPVSLGLEARGRTPFGAHFTFTLRPE